MISSWLVAVFGLMYIGLLFCIAYIGDKPRSNEKSTGSQNSQNLIYALSLAVYCSSWTFYGAVGTAASVGYDYLAIFLGPLLMYLLGYGVIKRIIVICKATNITSISDFIASRFGKSRQIAVLVTLIAVVGSIPYIALQLKAVSTSYTIITVEHTSVDRYLFNDTGFYVTAALALFTILFGTRHLNAAEHHRGLILAVAFESIVKLIAILAIGYYAVFLLLDTNSNIPATIGQTTVSQIIGDGTSTWQSFLTKTLLAMSAILLLPRQFHVTIVEANHHQQLKTAAWVMPLYLVLTSIVVLPIALSGQLLQPENSGDLYVLSLPLQNNHSTLALIAFIGGASAATGMVIVTAIALSTMISNDLVVPSLLRSKRFGSLEYHDLSRFILLVRRLAIIGLLLLAYVYYIYMDSNQGLANIGLTAFAATAQLVPAVTAALYWRKANKRGIFWGLIAGFSIWFYCLLLPTLVSADTIGQWLTLGSWLHPQSLFGFQLSNPLTHGTIWSLLINAVLIIVISLRTDQDIVEQVQANFYLKPFLEDSISNKNEYINLKDTLQFSPSSRVPVTLAEIQRVAEKFIGKINTNTLIKRFEDRQDDTKIQGSTVVDMRLLSQVHTAIGGVIGVSSAQKIMSEELSVGVQFYPHDSPLIRETSDVLRFNRNLMQATLENISQGIAVVDENLNLVIWNDRYIELFNYPKSLIYSGMPIRNVLEFNANRNEFGSEDKKTAVQKRLRHLVKRLPYEHISTRSNGRVIKHIGNPMPSGGYVTSYQDISSSVAAAKLLERANEDLEERVKERTMEFEKLAQQLKIATQSKTSFLAAASHDLLQPINAARLFSHSIKQRKADASEVERLAERVELSLNNANQLLSALLDISKLDGGGITPEITRFDINDLIQNICVEFEEPAQLKGIEVRSANSSVVVETDRNLLFSVLQNFVANAIRYSNSGDKVLIGVRKRKAKQLAEIQIIDNGIGIKTRNLSRITDEFFRIHETAEDTKQANNSSRGIGLGLAIANRISALLNTNIRIESKHGKGSLFSIKIPMTSQVVRVSKETTSKTSHPMKSIAGKTILCLDNDAIVLDSLISVLEDWGCEVLAAETFQQAREFFSKDVDAILADYQLGGSQTGAKFLNMLAGHNSPIVGVLITAVKDDALKQEALAGGWHLLRKPLETAELREILNQLSS